MTLAELYEQGLPLPGFVVIKLTVNGQVTYYARPEAEWPELCRRAAAKYGRPSPAAPNPNRTEAT